MELGLLSTKLGITSSNLFKSSKLKSCECGCESKSSQEYELMFRMYKNQAIFIHSDYNMTINQARKFGQISTSNLCDNWSRYVDLRLEIINYLKKAEPSYYLSNELIINQILFDILRILIKYNRIKALSIHRKYLKKFKPKSPLNRTSYLIFYKILGFELSERIRSNLNL